MSLALEMVLSVNNQTFGVDGILPAVMASTFFNSESLYVLANYSK
jgi:hypothetical protein